MSDSMALRSESDNSMANVRLLFLFRHRCLVCNGIITNNLGVCAPCESELPVLNNYCDLCAEPLAVGMTRCGSCLVKNILYVNTKVQFYYAAPVDNLIIKLKFGHDLTGARVLGNLLAGYLIQNGIGEKPEIIVPVPLHSYRLRTRGYNQALEIARPVAKKLSIPIDRFSVTRVKNTMAQAQLRAKDRAGNVRGAFEVKKSFNYRHVAIIDDVITTGHTIMELAKTLYRHGVSRIDIWCCAKRSAQVLC